MSNIAARSQKPSERDFRTLREPQHQQVGIAKPRTKLRISRAIPLVAMMITVETIAI